MKLNIGAGDSVLDGFTPVDRLHGQEAYPLPHETGSVEEVYASHVLEHFPHSETMAVIAEWVRVLKPGGRIRIAVPSLNWIIDAFQKGVTDQPLLQFLMGGQTDANDFHKAAFDEAGLRWAMEKAGLVGIQKWTSTNKDCASLPVSLNLEGYKPADLKSLGERCTIVATMPRLNWTINRDMTTGACIQLGIPYNCLSGAYFDQNMERALESGLSKEYVITIDYDTVFTPDDVRRLVVLMDAHPEAGAIAAMQVMRGPSGIPLVSRNEHDPVTEAEVSGDIFKVKSCHFGLTIIRTSALKAMRKPWLHHQAAPDGGWGDGRIDADVGFWHKLNEVSQTYVTPRVNVGHLQEMVSWVNGAWGVTHQHLEEYRKSGKPANVRG